jgi:hypothetical protein
LFVADPNARPRASRRCTPLPWADPHHAGPADSELY